MDKFPRINEFHRQKFGPMTSISDIDNVIDHNGHRIAIEGKKVEDIEGTTYIKVGQWKILRDLHRNWIDLYFVFHNESFSKFKWVKLDKLSGWPTRKMVNGKYCMEIPLHNWETKSVSEHFEMIEDLTGAERKKGGG